MAEPMTLEQLQGLPLAETQTREAHVPGWPGPVVIRQFSLADQRAIREEARGEDGEIDQAALDALTIQRALVQPAVTLEHAGRLLRTRFGPVQRLLNEIHEFSGLTELLQMSAPAVAAAERRFRQR